MDTNVKEVRELLIDAIAKLGITNEKKDIIVRLQSFDDSCITLKILVWLNVLTQGMIYQLLWNVSMIR